MDPCSRISFDEARLLQFVEDELQKAYHCCVCVRA